MTTRHIIYIPGKNPKPQAPQHRELLWRTLVEGVRRADSVTADALRACYSRFHLISWNYLYYHQYKDITMDIPWIDALINKHGPTEQDIQDANSWNIWLERLMLTLWDHLPFLIRLLPEEVRSTASEISRYFDNTDQVASRIRRLLARTLRPMLEKQEGVLLIGHSLGSVIAYDTLWELSRQEGVEGKVDFLTLGSPLGLHYVQRRLLGMNDQGKKSYPDRIRRWINLSAEGDVTALNCIFNESFHTMLEQGLVESIEDHSHGIYNFFRSNEGLNCHRSYGYLVNPAVGSIIADWWKHR
jgi:predicted alpha/beta superfamily hydrolase